MEAIRVGLFSDSFPPIMDGVSLTVKNYAYWLNRSNNLSYVFTPEFPGYTDKEEFPVFRYLSAPIFMRHPYRLGIPQIDYRINPALRNISLDLVHAHSPFSAGYLALKTARQNHIPIVATFHTKYKDDFGRFITQKSILNQLVKKIITFYDMADEVWIPQRHVEETIREYGFKGKLEVVENGSDLFVEDNIRAFRALSRKILGISQNSTVLLYVGQLILEKNLRFLLESLRFIQTDDFQIYFIGQGYAKPLLEKIVQEFGLTLKVKFIGTVYDRDELKRFYASADLFLFPSLYDNDPLVLHEAAALHTPALVLKDSTIGELIHDKVNGFLSENDPRQYSERINQLINNNEQLIKAGDNAADTLCRSWHDVVSEVEDRYARLIKKTGYYDSKKGKSLQSPGPLIKLYNPMHRTNRNSFQ